MPRQAQQSRTCRKCNRELPNSAFKKYGTSRGCSYAKVCNECAEKYPRWGVRTCRRCGASKSIDEYPIRANGKPGETCLKCYAMPRSLARQSRPPRGCETCRFIQQCRLMLNRRDLGSGGIELYCFAESKFHHAYVSVYGQVIP